MFIGDSLFLKHVIRDISLFLKDVIADISQFLKHVHWWYEFLNMSLVIWSGDESP